MKSNPWMAIAAGFLAAGVAVAQSGSYGSGPGGAAAPGTGGSAPGSGGDVGAGTRGTPGAMGGTENPGDTGATSSREGQRRGDTRRGTESQAGAHGPGEPGTQAEPPNAPGDLRERYEQTEGAHAERPGKHSTTTGRHGTSGQIGGGTNTQSGAGVAPSENPVLDKRQGEEREAHSPD